MSCHAYGCAVHMLQRVAGCWCTVQNSNPDHLLVHNCTALSTGGARTDFQHSEAFKWRHERFPGKHRQLQDQVSLNCAGHLYDDAPWR